MDDIRTRHPRFRGNWEDLRQFEQLASSRIRHQERELALQEWQRYKLRRQFEAFAGERPGKKGAHMRALIAPVIDLTAADLDSIIVGYADLRGAILDHCYLRGAWLKGVNLENASLRNVDFQIAPDGPVANGNLTQAPPDSRPQRGAARLLGAQLRGANFTGARLCGVDLSCTSLDSATLVDADLTDADLTFSSLVRANVSGAIFQNTRVYGVSAWDLKGIPKTQRDLIIDAPDPGGKPFYYVLEAQQARAIPRPEHTSQPAPDEPPNRQPGAALMIDNLELAQFVHLLLRNEKIRDVIDTLGAKGVLILGRFSDERKPVLEALREALRNRGFVPMIFDFQRPTQRDFTETIKTLAGLSRFIIADITNPRSSPLELQATIPDYMVPFVPIIEEGEAPFAMFQDLQIKYRDWVLDTLAYDSIDGLMRVFDIAVVDEAMKRSAELVKRRADVPRVRHVDDYQAG